MRSLCIALLLGCLVAPGLVQAENYRDIEPEAYLSERFGGEVPAPSLFWVDAAIAERAELILAHPFHGRRVRYWQKDGTVVWVLDEIGMKKPITMGVEVRDGKISNLTILVFREERGGEVRNPAWQAGLQGLSLANDNQLDREIDGITGATLSVGAVDRVARLVLAFQQALDARH